MILILGSVRVLAAQFEEALALSQQHVLRSREEPGCLEHGVSVSAESPTELVFVERWASMEALKAHFKVPASREFSAAIANLSSAPPKMTIYDATEVPPRSP